MSAEEDEMREMVGGCCVCSDERGWDENPLVYCDGQGCNVAVHQACYGIVTVPSGPWFCRKCESQERSARVRCELCPSRDGALKRTDQNGWAHVVCALYIPEVRFGNVTTMEPILISLIPPERFNKTCCICEDNNRGSKCTVGACMQCNKPGCKQNFHVTCAQMQGLLCEEAGNMDNVKYCGYCQYHYGKLKATRNMKIIPPFRPVPSSSNPNVDSPSSSPEKAGNGTKAMSSLSMNEESKTSTAGAVGNSQRGGPNSGSNSGDNSSNGKKSSNISPDIDSSASIKNAKNGKKGNAIQMAANKASNEGTMPIKTGSATLTPKIAQPVLTAATFSASVTMNKNNAATVDDKGDNSGSGTKVRIVGKGGETDSPLKIDDSCTIKLERVDNPLKGSSHGKKDFSSLQLKEVVTAALDRPITSTGNKFDLVSSALTGGIDPPLSSVGSNSSTHSSGRHSHHGDKPAPPDIKPHVTLTPIPMKGANTRMSLTRVEEIDRDEKDHQKDGAKSKTTGGSLSFHNSFGPPKLQNQSQQGSPDGGDNSSKVPQQPDLNLQNDTSPIDKTTPPLKRLRASSREEDRERNKLPIKSRGGRRGLANSGYSKRETSNGSFADENSMNDDPMDGTTSSTGSTRGGRSGPGRKPGTSRLSGRPVADDPPAPTLSQLKSQMENNAESPLSALPSHMFGNALNPASSMAQRMVDTLSQEVEAAVAAGAGGIPDIISAPTPLVGIALPGKPKSVPAAVNGTTLTPVTSATPATGSPPTIEQLLERQWEQGSQFLMEQAEHLDIAQLLSCLNQLKQDNRALEDHIGSLTQRKDQLTAVNARLQVPFGSYSLLSQLGHGFTNPVNGTNHNNTNGTPPPTLQPQSHMHPGGSKSLQISSTPSSQQHHELMIQQGRHAHREDRYPVSSEMQVSRTEIGIAHPLPSPHNHPGHNQRGQNVAPYGYSGHPVPVVTSHPSSHPQHH